MDRVVHDRNRSTARRCTAPAAQLIAAALSVALAGCNIVQGYEQAGDAIFPEQSTHLAAPGVQLVRGNYRELGVAGGSELFLLARAADDDTARLFVMPYIDPRPCELSGVVRFSVTNDEARQSPIFSYFSEDVRKGTLRFADTTCRTFPLTFDEARLPIAETERGLVVWAGSDLWLATPETGERQLLAEGVDEVTRGVLSGRSAVRTNGRLKLFDAAWKELGTFGDEVRAVLRANRSLFYEDAIGVHRVVASDTDPELLESQLLVQDGCSLASQDGVWVALRSPCSDGDVLVIDERSAEIFALPFEAEPSELQLVPALNSRGRDPLSEPFWFFYVRSGESESSPDALFVRTPTGDEHRLGAHGTLRHLRLVESEGDAYGYALVDVDGETGRYVWWDATGETRELAASVMWRPDRLIVDFDGTVGDVAVVSEDRLLVVARRVPWQAFEYQAPSKQWTVLFHEMDEGGMGRLSVFENGLDHLQDDSRQTFEPPALSPVASDVVVAGTSAMDQLLSGIIYLKDFDVASRTGRLEYRNLELRFTAPVNDGVSDYLLSSDEVLYAIPYGDDAGIWLVPGK